MARDQRDEIAEISSSGTVEPRGSLAQLRLQSRSGEYRVLPAPAEVVLLKRATGDGLDRACLVFGEIRAPGSLCDLLGFVSHTGWRGEFVVKDEHSTRSLFFDQGNVVGAKSTVLGERLGEVLYRHGVLTREQVDRCSDATAEGALRFGENAVRLGFIARESLFRSMGRQIEEIAYGALLVGSGTYFFMEGFEEEQVAARQQISVNALLREGIRRMHEIRYFKARLPSLEHVPVLVRAPSAVDALGVTAAIDGEASIAAICRKLGQGEFEVMRVLFQLVQAGHVVVNEPRLSLVAAVKMYNAAISLLLRELDAMDEGDPVRVQLAAFAAAPPLADVFLGAGPADDGTLDEQVIDANVQGTEAPAALAETIPAKLHEMASYALFLARPHLARVASNVDAARPRLSTRVAAMLEPLGASAAPKRGGTP